MTDAPSTKKSSPLLIAAAWLVVILPAGWGLSFTVKNAVKIFARPEASAAPTAPLTSTTASAPPIK